MSMSLRGAASLAVLVGCFTACQPMTPPPPEPSLPSTAPLFVVDENDAKLYQTLAKEQDARLARCAQDRSCDQAHFTRGLIALFENQQTAAKHFQDVIALAPRGRLSSISEAWLKVLSEKRTQEERETPFMKSTQAALLELLQHEQDVAHREQNMRQELTMRDKKLEELTAQIEILKQIDQEMNEKSARTRPKPKPAPGFPPGN